MMRKNHKICLTCAYWGGNSKICQFPDLSPDIFHYAPLSIENLPALRFIMSGIDRALLRSGEASRVVAHRAAMFTGTCPHHADKSGKTIPANFPAGYEERNGLYFKTDAEGNVTEIRNLFGCDITASADINLLFGCRTKGGSE